MKHYQKLLSYLQNPNPEALKLSLRDVHAKGMFSLVINGTEPGKLTRVFIANEELLPHEVQFHTHRYPIKLTVLNGNITHHEAKLDPDSPITMYKYLYRNPLNGGSGLMFHDDVRVRLSEYHLPVGSVIDLDYTDFHTMSVSKGSVWVVEEQGFRSDYSFVLGIPFITDDLYQEPHMFQINDSCQIVVKHLKNIINACQSINK